LILVGGYGTRLRPLTFSKAKPLVEFANKPILFHQIDALRLTGVREVILAVSYRPDDLLAAIKEYNALHSDIKLSLSLEKEPLGTAGPIALARDVLMSPTNGEKTEAVFVLNSDVSCEFHFDKLLAFHRSTGGEGTIMTTPVEDPSKYGVVVADDNGRIDRFVEKPATFVGNKINAGIYLLSPAFIDRIPLKPTSIEVDVFPVVAAAKQLFALELPGFWMDIGQPRDYLRGNHLYLNALRTSAPKDLATSERFKGITIVGNVLIHASATIGAGSVIGPDVVIGAECKVGEGVLLQRCTLLQEVVVAAHAHVSDAIIGWRCSLGRWSHVVNNSVLGMDIKVGEAVFVNGVICCPHKSIKASILDAGHMII